jgi:hypothetical protein
MLHQRPRIWGDGGDFFQIFLKLFGAAALGAWRSKFILLF